jgi:alkylation response protein AidB-like acyl-CoA dehydrogenase
MKLAPTDEQQQLKDAVRRFCTEQVTAERLVAWEKSHSGVDDSLWRAVAELGWLGLGLPATIGGSGLGFADVACLVEECGRGLIPRPIINAIRSGAALAWIDPGAPELAAIASGEHSVALAFAERQVRLPHHYRTTLVAGVDGEVVSGEKWYVSDAARADWHLVATRVGDEVSFALVDSARASCVPLRTFDGDRQSLVRYDGAPIKRRIAASGAELLATLQRRETALALAEMVGGMDAVLAMAVEYVKQREQFGQKLAVFQAVQHQIADMATSYTSARHLAWQAITRLSAGTEQATEVAVAAAFVGQAYKRLTLAALHLHGGAGYVVEHPLHYYAERAQSLCIRDTPEAPALAAVAASLLDG